MTKFLIFLELIAFIAVPIVSMSSELSWQDFLKQMVEINSGTQNLEGLKSLKKILIQEFSSLGFQVKEIPLLPSGRSLLVIEMKDAQPTIGFYGHIDTVFQKDSPFQTFEIDQDSIRGPGVIDMKGGIALMREILREVKTTHPERLKDFRILLNDDEETGSMASKDALDLYSKGLNYGLIFEFGDEQGALVSSQSGVSWIELSIYGKAAHAGLEHKAGKNACVELSRALPILSKQTNYRKNFTVNIGTLSGGTVPNIVCEKATTKIDLRYVDPQDLKKFKKLLTHTITQLNPGFHGEWSTLVEIPSLSSQKTALMNQAFEKSAKRVGEHLSTIHVGYVADSNHLQQVNGLNLLVGIGPYGSGAHSAQERMQISSFELRKKLVLDWFNHQASTLKE